ncbi:sulfonate ABC transporter ATP-binding protein [Puniceibacterium antarcticum]|uniref:Sulfonate ABC transporter ATP-binding protein n=1 Tax=Puniceibacterium antarcticum TaxID=1206336 RepID=A0A2G8RL25_9RHOB|nr:ABC transporter ATP-binding protein [Puniceibacterium antarcticum]PIL22193.1 sulfonate ABC transporter ATP-binding protein [Puniceibacterium antarcticum]
MSSIETRTKGEVTIRDLTKSFKIDGETLTVLRKVSLDIRGGESLAIVGASGSGKTTLLRVLAGLEEPDGGDVLIDGAPVHGLGRERAVIFQEPRLLLWLRVLGNVAFGLEVQGVDRAEAEERARRYIRLVGLTEFETAWPRQLSGGMAQRVGIARALTVQPEILLLDEPLGALDAMTKMTMQEELTRIWDEEKVTMVLVTHDLEEAIYLADRVLVLPKEKGGSVRLLDIDLPRPRDRNGARFVTFRKQLMAEFGLH